MDIVNAREADLTKNPHQVKASRLYDTEHAQVVHLTLEPGESLKKHMTPVDVFFYVLEGSGIVEVGNDTKEVGPDTLISSPARIAHNWTNQSDKPFRALVVKVPRPTEATKLL